MFIPSHFSHKLKFDYTTNQAAAFALSPSPLSPSLGPLQPMAGKGLPGPLRLFILIPFSFLVILLSNTNTASLSIFANAAAAALTEADALLEFKSTLSVNGGEGEAALSTWAPGSNPCTVNKNEWKGVLCTKDGNVWALQLERMGFSGQLNITPLTALPSLRALSFMDNAFSGPLPDFAQVGALKALFLSNNHFSGELPDGAFLGTRSLKKIFMSNNKLSGKIPSSLTVLTKLIFLRMDANDFVGPIPDLKQPGLQMINMSYNHLEGMIPDSLSDQDQTMFAGNEKLCGPPLANSCPPPPLPPSEKKSHGLLICIIVACIAVLLILAVIIFLAGRGQKEEKKDHTSAGSGTTAKSMDGLEAGKLEQGSSANDTAAAAAAANGGSTSGGGKKGSKDGEHGKLSFVKEEREKFDLSDLLKASAEVLGSGNFGSSYKAVLMNGPSVVVKRFKEMNRVGREEFQEHMRRLGRLSNPNVLPLVAYYYRKEEKLIITNYILNGSLAHMLHGNRGSNLPPLDWPKRLKIIKGVARGLFYLYEELPMLTLPHGHLKSANVLINDNYEPLLTDYALVPVVNQSHASQVMVAYKSPEVTATGKPSKKSDVWSLGILILEVLTGKFPATYLQKGKGGTDLAGWVSSVAKEEWTGEEFGSEMKMNTSGQGQMVKMLQIGLGCCEGNVEKRWEMKVALEKIEEIKERGEGDEEEDSSVLSEVELSSTKDS